MEKQIAIELVSNVSPTVTTRSGASNFCNFRGGGHFPILGIIVITNDNKKQAR